MPPSICHSCRWSFQTRLSRKIHHFQQLRRPLHVATKSHSPAPSSLYWSTLPPTDREVQIATWFFTTFQPTRLWTAEEWRKQNQTTPGDIIPEVAFLGRSNVGKSTLLNALLNKPGLNPVGPKPGKTVVMTAWGLSPTTKTRGALPGFEGDTSTRLTVLDVPGYGFRSHASWGAEITKYLSRRKHLRKVFILIDTNHGIVARDNDMFRLLRSQDIPHQVIASKADNFSDLYGSGDRDLQHALLKIAHASQVREPGELLVTSSRRKQDHEESMEGIGAVRWSVLRAVGLDSYATQQFNKIVKPGLPPDAQEVKVNAPNPFKMPEHVYKTWVGGNFEPTMGGIPSPIDYEQDKTPPAPSIIPTGLPSSHPRAVAEKTTQLRPRLNLQNGLEALLTPNQLASQIRSRDPPLTPPPTPPADPRSRTTKPAPTYPISSSAPSAPSAPKNIDTLLALIQNKSNKQSSINPPAPRQSTQTPPARLSDLFRAASPPSTPSPSPFPPPASSTSNPNVSRGIDAFMALTQPPPKPQPRQRTSSSRNRPPRAPAKSNTRTRQSKHSPPPAPSTPSQPSTPSFTGTGVSRGIDAFISATQTPSARSRQTSGGQKGSPGTRKRRRY